MKLYHFCAAHTLDAIKREGLTIGSIPYHQNNKIFRLEGFRWLTKNRSFHQEWEIPGENSKLKFRRNDYRITVKIPQDDSSLVRWLDACEDRILHETAKFLNYAGDPENWYVYAGNITPAHFREIVENIKPTKSKL